MCAHQPNQQCQVSVEQCTDGVDNDGDGLVDCNDPDCANDPACRPHEICGDCIDNDGDGLVDNEDPDCCPEMTALELRRLMLKPTAKVGGNGLNLRARSAGFSPAGFDPSTQYTTLQLADGRGTLFCQTVEAPHWKHPSPRMFRFRDKTSAFAGGLKRGKFKVKRNGQIVFRTRGKKMALRPTDGGPVRVTLRVGNQCAQFTATLHAKRKALVFP
jgi:hypothetical protein